MHDMTGELKFKKTNFTSGKKTGSYMGEQFSQANKTKGTRQRQKVGGQTRPNTWEH